jgi:hypothetical protein
MITNRRDCDRSYSEEDPGLFALEEFEYGAGEAGERLPAEPTSLPLWLLHRGGSASGCCSVTSSMVSPMLGETAELIGLGQRGRCGLGKAGSSFPSLTEVT